MSADAEAPRRARTFRWADMAQEAVKPDLRRRLVTGERMMVAEVELDAGCVVPKHAHMHEQLTGVVEGALHFTLGEDGDEEVTVSAGEVIHLPSHLPHAAVARERTRVLDLYSPPREDWASGTDAYRRR